MELRTHIRHASFPHRAHSLEGEPHNRQVLSAKGGENTKGVLHMYLVGMLERASEMLLCKCQTRSPVHSGHPMAVVIVLYRTLYFTHEETESLRLSSFPRAP